MLKDLGYDTAWILRNKLKQPLNITLANKHVVQYDVLPMMEFNINGHLIKTGNILTSLMYPVNNLLGVDILSYFDLNFRFGEKRLYYAFNPDKRLIPTTNKDGYAFVMDNPVRLTEDEQIMLQFIKQDKEIIYQTEWKMFCLPPTLFDKSDAILSLHEKGYLKVVNDDATQLRYVLAESSLALK